MARSAHCIAILIILSVLPGLAQSGTPTHHHTQANVIDGAAHPELIPDLTAYRMFFVSVSHPATLTEGERKHQAAQISMIQLEDEDEMTFITVLTVFKSQYNGLIRAYNEQAAISSQRGESPNKNAFLLQRDQIVQSTRDALKARLTSNGWNHLSAYVQGEKRRMKLNVQEVGQ